MAQIKDLVENCSFCAQNRTPQRKPLLPTQLPDYPWKKVASDLFYLKEDTYIIITDYFFRYPEIIKLSIIYLSKIIEALKSIFSRHSIPQILEHSLPFLRNLIGQFQGTKSLICPQLRSPQHSCHLLSSTLLICPRFYVLN